MAAGLVSHNITTASGVTFGVISWVPDTGSPDVGAVPIARISDGTSVAAVKAASTAPVATDPALVVAISPNGVNANGQATSANSAPIVGASDWTQLVGGDTANDAADNATKPIKNGWRATTSQSALTLVADADRVNAYGGVDGIQITRPHTNLEDIVTGNATNTDGTSTQCIAAQAAGIKTYLTSIVLANTSAVAITVDIKDDTTVKVSLPLPAGSGCVFNPPVPIPGTAAKAWNFDPSAAATTVTCSMIGFKSKV